MSADRIAMLLGQADSSELVSREMKVLAPAQMSVCPNVAQSAAASTRRSNCTSGIGAAITLMKFP